MVPLHFLTPRYDLPIVPVNINCQGPPLRPLHRAWAFGEALRRAADTVPERIALVGTGGISHWPATPDSGRINEAGIANFSTAGSATTSRRCCPTPTRRPIATPGRAASRSAPSSAVAAAARGRGHSATLPADPDLRRRLHHRGHERGGQGGDGLLPHVAHDPGIQRKSARRRADSATCAASSPIHDRTDRVEDSRCFRPAACGCAPVRARTTALPTAACADAGFMHAILKIGAGRSDAAKRRRAPACSTS